MAGAARRSQFIVEHRGAPTSRWPLEKFERVLSRRRAELRESILEQAVISGRRVQDFAGRALALGALARRPARLVRARAGTEAHLFARAARFRASAGPRRRRVPA